MLIIGGLYENSIYNKTIGGICKKVASQLCCAFFVRGNVMGAKVENDMRFDLFKHLQELSYSFYAENKIGQIMARLTSDLTDEKRH